ncbi:MAG: hypothetical protein FJW39_05185 [Acidobacteria bacterium]|nr:hypothetical protein [Acidobacteriota bacterium]
MALSPQDRDLLRRLYRDTDPNKPIDPTKPGSEFYQPIYEGPGVEDPVKLLEAKIDFAETEGMFLLSGFRGSGKTTELLRLKQRLEAAGHLVLYADALQYVHPAQPVDITDLLISIAGALGDAIEERGGFGDPLHEGYWTRFEHFLRETKVEIPETGASGGGFSVKVSLRGNDSFRTRVRDALATRVQELENQVRKFAEDCVKAIRKRHPEGKVVFIFDQLEQIRGSLSGEKEVIQSIERLFANHIRRLELPYIHVVYTVPPWLKFVLAGTPVDVLHNVRQWNNDPQRTRFEHGCQSLLEVVQKRFGPDGMARFWANDAQPMRIIDSCGGHFKDLLKLLQETIARAAAAAELPVSDRVVDAALIAVRNSFLPIAYEDAIWLKNVFDSRRCALPSTGSEDVAHLTRLIDTHLILYLKNGEEWYDVHPLIRDDVIEMAAKPIDVPNGRH